MTKRLRFAISYSVGLRFTIFVFAAPRASEGPVLTPGGLETPSGHLWAKKSVMFSAVRPDLRSARRDRHKKPHVSHDVSLPGFPYTTGVVPGVSLGWMVVRFVYVIRVPVCARVSLVCPVCVVWVFSPVPVHAPVGKLGMDQWSGAALLAGTGVP